MNFDTKNHHSFDSYPKQIVLVRHGESHFNKVNITLGLDSDGMKKQFDGVSDLNVSLTDLGVNQAILTGKSLYNQGFQFDFAYHSGYRRTKDTLFHILRAFSEKQLSLLDIKEDFSLRERKTGYTLGMTKEEIKQHFPFIDDYFKRTGNFFSRPIGGESIADVFERIRISLQEIFRQTEGKKLLISSHGRVISVIRFILEDDWTLSNIEKFLSGCGPRNCGVTIYNHHKRLNKMLLQEYDSIYYKEV